MGQENRVLLGNALLSWVNAIRYCDQIKAGNITLGVRKGFVSSLHNAVELFLKQIMLDKCDYRVAEPRCVKADGEPAKTYYSASSLNSYFANMDSSMRSKFYSIDFSRFLDIHKELLSDYLQPGQSFKNELRILKDLRNSETHFYIGADEYLTADKFQSLYNFMIDFYNILHEFDLLPFWGEPRADYAKYGFVRKRINNFSYRKAVQDSPAIKVIANKLDGMRCENYIPFSAYEKATIVAEFLPEYSGDRFDELWAYIESMELLKILELVELHWEKYGDNRVYCVYQIKVNMT